ncbi:MAG: Uma2 family endonuclease [Cytophagales bacterium]
MGVTKLSDLDLNKTYTVLDYLSWQFDDMIELIKGKIYQMSPAPRSQHQWISQNLSFEIEQIKRKKRKCRIFVAPFDVYLQGISEGESTVVQPDICIICDRNKIVDRGCSGAPDLIIEILSPATLTKDVNIKYHLYEENGVLEYWIVDTKERQIITHYLDPATKKYIETGNYSADSQIKIGIWEGEFLNWSDVFDEM